MREVFFVFMVWVFPLIVVGTLVVLTVRRHREGDRDSGPASPPGSD
ncbi:MAG: hypothetical protein R6X29_12210 [Acidimicrobiia bacterium]